MIGQIRSSADTVLHPGHHGYSGVISTHEIVKIIELE
jgi:hypothetical protein